MPAPDGLPRRLRLARSRRGWSRELLASELERRGGGISTQALGMYERGEADPSFGRAVALADALGVSPSWLAGREPLGWYGGAERVEGTS